MVDFGTDFEAFLSFLTVFLGDLDFEVDFISMSAGAGAVKKVLNWAGWLGFSTSAGLAIEELLLGSLRRDLPLDSSSTTTAVTVVYLTVAAFSSFFAATF